MGRESRLNLGAQVIRGGLVTTEGIVNMEAIIKVYFKDPNVGCVFFSVKKWTSLERSLSMVHEPVEQGKRTLTVIPYESMHYFEVVVDNRDEN